MSEFWNDRAIQLQMEAALFDAFIQHNLMAAAHMRRYFSNGKWDDSDDEVEYNRYCESRDKAKALLDQVREHL